MVATSCRADTGSGTALEVPRPAFRAAGALATPTCFGSRNSRIVTQQDAHLSASRRRRPSFSEVGKAEQAHDQVPRPLKERAGARRSSSTGNENAIEGVIQLEL